MANSIRCVMQSMSAKDAKHAFGRLIDLARAQPILVQKHGRAVVVVLAVEEYERLRDRAGEADIDTAKETKARNIHRETDSG